MMNQADRKALEKIFAKMEIGDFAEVADMFRAAQSNFQRKQASTFRIGDSVYFDSKRGMRVSGEIVKINHKTIQINTVDGSWKVSPSLLQHA